VLDFNREIRIYSLLSHGFRVVFYDMTTIRAEGLSEQEGDVRKFGMSKEGIIARQVMLGVVQTADGLPLYHEVFDGNTGEVSTLKPTIKKLIERFPVKRVIAVADRGLLSIDNLEELQAIELPGGGKLEFILAVPGRRYTEFVDLLQPLRDQCANANAEVVMQTTWNKLRLGCGARPHRGHRGKRQTRWRDQDAAGAGRHVGGQTRLAGRWKGRTRAQALRWRRAVRASTMRSVKPVSHASCGSTSRLSCSPTILMRRR
jgi:hypothetical protein